MNYEILGRINTIIKMEGMVIIYQDNNIMSLHHLHTDIIKIINIPLNQILKMFSAPYNNKQISLKSLDSMRKRGLISEETYIKKVQELGY